MLPNVSADDVGNPKAPGEYRIDNHYFKVDRSHLAVWEEDPNALFRTVLCTRVGDNRIRLALSSRVEA